MEQTTDETHSLRRCVRELAALSVLSAAWGRTGPQGIAESLAEVLLRSLPHVNFVYVRVNGVADAAFHEAVRISQPLEPTSRSQDIARALEPVLKDGNSVPSPVIPNPIGAGTVRLAVLSIGYLGDCGVLVAGSGQLDFPGPTDQLLLGVAANQAAVVLQHQRSEEALRQQSALLHDERELLRQSEERFRGLMEQAPFSVQVFAPDGRTIRVNRAWEELWGVTLNQIPDYNILEDVQLEAKGILPYIKRAFGGEPVAIPAIQYDPNETIPNRTRHHDPLRWVAAVAYPLKDSAARVREVVLVHDDITTRRRAEDELREADRRKDEFLATLAHELRNPLAPIRNSLQILKMPRLDAVTLERSREMMERQVQHLVRLVDDLLDVSRVMRGKVELKRERVELATVVARAVETAQPLMEAQGHELAVTMPPESLPLEADPVRLAQVVGNLLTNAAKYTEANGRIRLTALREGNEAVLRVRDGGIGIAPNMLPRIFELFVQVDHATARSQGGLGIGLTLVKNLVEMHNGTVEAKSEGLGKGTEFVVRLPLSARGREEPEGQEFAENRPVAPPPGHRLLVVDDNEDAADSLAMLLRLEGHEVRLTYDGPAALEMAKGYRPDMVFLDIGMPGMDGYEVARRLRQQAGLENVRLAALTGWGQQEDRRRSAEAGFDHHLVKPVEPKDLQGLLAQLKLPKGSTGG
jgi:PAS domain S-box-containing protein